MEGNVMMSKNLVLPVGSSLCVGIMRRPFIHMLKGNLLFFKDNNPLLMCDIITGVYILIKEDKSDWILQILRRN